MITQFLFWVLLSLLSLHFTSAHYAFEVVSTSPKPPDNQQFKEAITQIEKTFKEELQKVSRRLEVLEQENSLTLRHCTLQEKVSKLPKNCQEVSERGYDISSTYLIHPDFVPNATRVLCELEKKGGGWTYILKRFDGSQDFNLDWDNYKVGFGDLHDEFWLGLENIHHLTGFQIELVVLTYDIRADSLGYKINELLVELVDWNGTEAYAHYSSFSVGSEKEGYNLKILKGYNGTAGDSLNYQSTMKFTTKDKDNDFSPDNNCASYFGGGWWFNYCKSSFLTAQYVNATVSATNGRGIHWDTFRGYSYSLKEARMMVRSKRTTN